MMQEQDELHWFPMRVTYSREMMVKSFLDELGVESFIPMHYESVEGKHPRCRVLKPAVRYMMRPLYDGKDQLIGHDVMTVPDKQMEDFMRVASVADDRVFFMENLNFVGKPGQRVKVVEGDFAGVEGVIKRIKKNKCVVVQIEHVAAVAIAFVPSTFLVTIEN